MTLRPELARLAHLLEERLRQDMDAMGREMIKAGKHPRDGWRIAVLWDMGDRTIGYRLSPEPPRLQRSCPRGTMLHSK